MEQDVRSDVAQFRQLRKGYAGQDRLSVDNVTLGVQQGELFGFLGNNGAGKSTLVKLLTSLIISPTEGKVTIMGIDVDENVSESRKSLGYCMQLNNLFPNLFPNLTVEEHLKIFAMIHGHNDVQQMVTIICTNLQLDKYPFIRSSMLSGGNKRKLMACITLLGNPKLIVLDEPSTRMDPVAQRFLWNTLQHIHTRNTCSIILVSHSFPEIEALCDRVAIICEGKLRCIGTWHHLSDKFGKFYSVQLAFSDSFHDIVIHQFMPLLQRIYGQCVCLAQVRNDQYVEIRISKNAPGVSVPHILRAIHQFSVQFKVKFASIGVSTPILSDVFSSWIQKVNKEGKKALSTNTIYN